MNIIWKMHEWMYSITMAGRSKGFESKDFTSFLSALEMASNAQSMMASLGTKTVPLFCDFFFDFLSSMNTLWI